MGCAMLIDLFQLGPSAAKILIFHLSFGRFSLLQFLVILIIARMPARRTFSTFYFTIPSEINIWLTTMCPQMPIGMHATAPHASCATTFILSRVAVSTLLTQRGRFSPKSRVKSRRFWFIGYFDSAIFERFSLLPLLRFAASPQQLTVPPPPTQLTRLTKFASRHDSILLNF